MVSFLFPISFLNVSYKDVKHLLQVDEGVAQPQISTLIETYLLFQLLDYPELNLLHLVWLLA